MWKCISVGDDSMIGAGATVIQGIAIGSRTMIGAGSTFIKNVENDP